MSRFRLEEMRDMAKAVFLKAVSAVDPYQRLKEIAHIDKNRLIIGAEEVSEKVFDLNEFERIFLVGTGKASSSMAQAIEEIFGGQITKGLITTKYGHALPLRYTEIIEAGHPLPDPKGLQGARKIKDLLTNTGPKDLVLFLISGGGSALLPLPADKITLEEKQELTQFLLDCGADIKEINTIRKHISQMKGGWLARWAFPSTVITFILSDVVGDPLDVIASGPTVPDTSTFQESWEILKRYGLINEIASSIRNHLQAGREGKIKETPKAGESVFEKVHNMIIGSNIVALRAAEKEFSLAGFNTIILSSSIVGETREAARFHGAIAREVVSTGKPIDRPACILSGGETTVTIRGSGLGGRNQEFALAGAFEISGLEKTVLLSGGTDGTDGPTDAAGAMADHTTITRARQMGLDSVKFLENNDSYHFFEKLGDLLITGPTRTNVMDVRILLVD
ncbi:MAG: glycerate kinase [Desulfobacterales bacterium]|nr:glycerate kinase [Desulfobacterales bacterium]